IPIELDVPVVTRDDQEIGIAREILCPCPGDIASNRPAPHTAPDASCTESDLWLRVTRPALSELYIPFGEIAETRSDEVRLRVTQAELASQNWRRLPASLPIPA